MESSGATTILRWGLAFVFLYAAVAALLNPSNWVVYVPAFIGAIMPPLLFLKGFSLYQLVLAGFLFSGKKLWWSSLFATITLGSIVVFDFQALDIIFRDIGLAFAAFALFQEAQTNHH